MSAELVILFIALIFVISSVMTKVCFHIGIPTLVMFLSIGMIVGADGIGGLDFNDPSVAQIIGIFALSFITFSGGLQTDMGNYKPILSKSLLLASVGVLITAVLTGIMAVFVLDFSVLEGMLLGAVVSSTDAAATFSILRSNGVSLKNNLDTLLESESGSNDPFAYILTITVLAAFTSAESGKISAGAVSLLLSKQVIIGALFGISMGYLVPIVINKIKLHGESLYPMFVIAIALLIFSGASLLGGNGLLAIYIAGILIGNKNFVHKKPLLKFFEGQTWIMQVVLFVMLGLLVYPSQLPPVAHEGIITALFILFVARPIAVFGILSFFKQPVKEMLLISWAGLRGAASMVFAIFPLMAGLSVAPRIFNIVFFVALTSILFQGTLLPHIARWLGLTLPFHDVVTTDDFSRYIDEMEDSLMDVHVVEDSFAVNKSLFEIRMPDDIRIIRVKRGSKLINPTGKTVVQQGDRLLLVAQGEDCVELVRNLFELPQNAEDEAYDKPSELSKV